MKHLVRGFASAFFLFAVLAPLVAATGSCLPDGTQTSGAKYRICMPESGRWNGDLVVFAHGYVDPAKPVAIPEDQLALPDGTSIPEIVNTLGYAFAVTSYSVNGLAVTEGMKDLQDLVGVFAASQGSPGRVYLVGVSEGGLITALSIEQHPELYSGGLAACGPIGDFPAQINYIGNFRVVFDYFFPGVIPGTADSVPSEVITNWDKVYVPEIQAAIAADPSAARQLLNVTRAPVGLDPDTVAQTVVNLLWYAVFTTNDAKSKLGGQPFNNKSTIYRGSRNDVRLNAKVARFSADPAALSEMQTHYQTSGRLQNPLVTIHTTGDEIVPYWHERYYGLKSLLEGSLGLFIGIPVFRYGHCSFNAAEAVAGFFILVARASMQELTDAEQALPDEQSRRRFRQLLESLGISRR